jgi:diketogulonate reductase-like aldo/keto reductase
MATVTVNGVQIPTPGFGTYLLVNEKAQEMVKAALEIGYRHIDTAQFYQNEEEVGAGLRASGVDRAEVFLTTKVWPENYSAEQFKESVDESLTKLGVEYVDLLLLHWPPQDAGQLEEIVGWLNEAAEAGKAKHIGVSNFTVALFEKAVAFSKRPLIVNQVEYHPMLDQSALLRVAKKHDACLTAYCPLAQGRAVDERLLKEIGESHGKSAAQIALRWLVQQERVVPIPKSSSRERAEQNLAVLDFELSDDEMKRISALGSASGRVVNPAELAPEWD